MKYNKFQKIACLILIISIIFPTVFLSKPQKVEAIPVFDFANVVQNTLSAVSTGLSAAWNYITSSKETVLDPLAYYAARILIRQLTQSIVDWINNGFDGNPSFVQDPRKFLMDTADRTIGEFIFDSNLNFLCKPFEIDVRLALGLQYNPFQDKIRCKLSSVLQNIDGTMTDTYNKFVSGDFIAGGGWDSWLQLTTVPQNNQLGAMIIAQAELDAKINAADNSAQKDLSWSGGVLSMKKCQEDRVDKNGKVLSTKEYRGDPTKRGITGGSGSSTLDVIRNNESTGEHVVTSCKIVTPGSLINDQLERATGSDLTQLQLADEFNEIVGALVNFTITKIMTSDLLSQRDRNVEDDDRAWRDGIAALTAQQNSNFNQTLQNSTGRDLGTMLSNMSNSITNANVTPGYDGGPGGINNSNSSVYGQINNVKSALLSLIESYKNIETECLYNYTIVYNVASTTSNKYDEVYSCYSDKLSSTTLNLTSNDRQSAESSMSVASSTKEFIDPIISSSTININYINSNISTLQSIQDGVNRSTTMEEIATHNNNLSSIITILHTTEDLVNAQNLSSSTMSTFVQGTASSTALLQQAINMKTECEDFPL